jgi:hypothetical protein
MKVRLRRARISSQRQQEAQTVTWPANDGREPGTIAAGRRSRQLTRRPRRVEFSLTEEEYSELGAAAARAGLARGAYAAEAALSVARGVTSPADSLFREALGELIRAAGLVRRIGVNLNQAVAKLNATGQHSGDLLPYAVESLRRVERLDAAAEDIRKKLR